MSSTHAHDHAHHHGHHPGHDHGHDHGHSHAPENFDRAFAIGISVNIAFVAIEAFYGWRVNSLALLADAGHNLGDVAGLVLAWGGALAGKLRPDQKYTYGWKRASIVAAGRNLHVWTPYSGVDPEATVGNGDQRGSEEYFATPPLRYFTFRLNLSF